MSSVVVYDGNVLYGNTLRDLLIRLAMTGWIQAKWTNGILDELQRNLAAKRPGIPEEKLSKQEVKGSTPLGSATPYPSAHGSTSDNPPTDNLTASDSPRRISISRSTPVTR